MCLEKPKNLTQPYGEKKQKTFKLTYPIQSAGCYV